MQIPDFTFKLDALEEINARLEEDFEVAIGEIEDQYHGHSFGGLMIETAEVLVPNARTELDKDLTRNFFLGGLVMYAAFMESDIESRMMLQVNGRLAASLSRPAKKPEPPHFARARITNQAILALTPRPDAMNTAELIRKSMGPPTSEVAKFGKLGAGHGIYLLDQAWIESRLEVIDGLTPRQSELLCKEIEDYLAQIHPEA